MLIPILICVAFLTLLERKILRIVGSRLGPNKVSWGGILQPLGDAAKLINKQINSLSNFSIFFYYASSFSLLFSRFIIFSFFFREPSQISYKFRILNFLLLLSLNSFNSVLSGWRTFGKFSLIGRIRTVTQLISYEASLFLCLFFFFLLYRKFDFRFLQENSLVVSILIPYCFFIWIPTFLAELNRTPYDFSEGESELVRGFNTEFGSSCFTLIFLSEYRNILFFSILSGFLFFNFPIIIFFFFFFVIWIRSVLPRYRFDKLIYLSWKFFIPFLTFMFLFLACFFI